MEIYEEILKLKKSGGAATLATIVQTVGSSPQKEGSKILVRGDGSTVGTLGGGCLEAEVIQACLMAMHDSAPGTIPFELTEKHGGLVCGGKVLVYIEPIVPRTHLVILGAGHVGKALSTAAHFCGFMVSVVDDRNEYADDSNLPDADEVIVSDFATVFDRVHSDRKTYLVIATRGHNHDLDALNAALRTEACYVGLLGSKRKRAILLKALQDKGFSGDDVARVITPVGLSIGSVTPEEIAISIMAQIIQHRRENGAPRPGHSSCGRLIHEDGPLKAAPSPK